MNYRVTVWPGDPLQLPPYASRGPYRWDSAACVLLPDLTSLPKPAEFGRETYLEVHALDLDEPTAILRFVNRYSALGVYDSESKSWPFFNGAPDDMEEYLAADLEHLALVRRQFVQRAVDEERVRLGAEGREPDDLWQHGLSEATDNDAFETIAEFRLAAELIHDAVEAWRGVLEDRTLADCAFVASASRVLFALDGPDSKVRSSRGAEEYLTWFFDRALHAFHPSVRLTETYPGDPAEGELVVPTRELAYRARPYSLCALQLYNHVATQAEIKLCANETCNRLFVEKEGSTTRRKPRRDSKYHDDRCANQQMQRRSRRRQAAKASSKKPKAAPGAASS